MTLAIPGHAREILRILTLAADAGTKCPTNHALAEAINSPSVAVSSNAVSLLETIGLITVIRATSSRQVTIVATGKSTAPVASKVRVYGVGTRPAPVKTAYVRKTRPEDYKPVEVVDPSRIVDRDPCVCCGTRRDIGCIHTRIAA